MPLVEQGGLDLLYSYRESASSIRERSSGFIRETTMTWTTPTLLEICIGLEINGYLPAEF
jgi:coenzyme PQQ precursor peptide PqqA